MVMAVPTGPLVGVKLAMAGSTVKLVGAVAVPLGVVTVRAPEVAPAGTVVLMVVLLTTVNVAVVPLKRTAVAPVKLVPVSVTLPLCTCPAAGV
ncbi:hypothetical protein EJV47_09085 [Hymenobacter gummosus]|uniref:Uncharacterized protein n=1 Tax=Hymenobacter gummosus TaxID=1776032 RepID=A0A431U514_9BACT|nr:hypothetical protein EJV47_09085 [Hymenobacter gummosus]